MLPVLGCRNGGVEWEHQPKGVGVGGYRDMLAAGVPMLPESPSRQNLGPSFRMVPYLLGAPAAFLRPQTNARGGAPPSTIISLSTQCCAPYESPLYEWAQSTLSEHACQEVVMRWGSLAPALVLVHIGVASIEVPLGELLGVGRGVLEALARVFAQLVKDAADVAVVLLVKRLCDGRNNNVRARVRGRRAREMACGCWEGLDLGGGRNAPPRRSFSLRT
mmetsp:Transcript_41437/g.129769  ORF Transcript_41437/g.129769 Transcript_41437/m.129769 type:complete len:219 (-) Transcript_41437:307-963(-)